MNHEPLLPRVAAGDREAVQAVLDRYGGLVWSLARRHTADRADAEDAVQEVFVELWHKAARFDPARGGESVFVGLIARRRLIDRARRRGAPRAAQELSETIADPGPGTEEVDLGDEAARAQAAFARLRPEQQRVLRLAIYEGLSHDEIARTTQLPLGTVKTHVRRGLARVRELLGLGTGSLSVGGEA